MDRLIQQLDKIAAEPLPPPLPAKPSAPSASELITNTLGMSFRRLAPGTYWMGAPNTDPDAGDDEKPRHQVTISRPHYLGIHPVTRGQFAQWVQATGYRTEAEITGGAHRYTGSH